LWSYAIELEPKATRKKKIVDALNQCQDDAYVNLAVAKLFWKERKYEKVKRWLEKAVLLNKSIGDSWCALYLF
jgi:pre-mRNA-processing factor 6